MQANEAATEMAPAEMQDTGENTISRFTPGSVKNKIKRMVVDLLNEGMRSNVYATNMVTPAHTFEQLNMTEHEKLRLIMQCDEFFAVDTDASALGIVRVGDLINKVVELLGIDGRIEVPAAKTETVEQEKSEQTEE
jgi:hypothetical protein